MDGCFAQYGCERCGWAWHGVARAENGRQSDLRGAFSLGDRMTVEELLKELEGVPKHAEVFIQADGTEGVCMAYLTFSQGGDGVPIFAIEGDGTQIVDRFPNTIHHDDVTFVQRQDFPSRTL
jgi:hypothetical protein